MDSKTIISNLTEKFSTPIRSFTSWDTTIFVFFVVVSIVYALLFVSRGKLLPLLVSTYMSYVLVVFAPFLTLGLGKSLGLTQLFEVRLLAFAIVFLVVFYVLSRVIFQSPVGAETFGLLSSFVLAVAETGFTIAILVSFLPREITKQFSELIFNVFVGNDQLFYWAAANVVLLLILGRKANQRIG